MDSFLQFLHHSQNATHPSHVGIALLVIKTVIAWVGTLVILTGVGVSAYRFVQLKFLPHDGVMKTDLQVDAIRRNLGLTIILGLEFIIAADVVETTTIPDYYSLGILAITVLIRTFLSYTLNREISKFPNTSLEEPQSVAVEPQNKD